MDLLKINVLLFCNNFPNAHDFKQSLILRYHLNMNS